MGSKAKKKKKQKPPSDALAISGIHLLALEVEQVATEAYVTCPGQLGAIVEALRAQIRSLRGICGTRSAALDEGICQDPYVECDGFCVMFCPNEEPPMALTAKAGKKNSKKR